MLPGLLFNSISKNIVLWPGAIAGRISHRLISDLRELEIRKKSILDFKRKGFDS